MAITIVCRKCGWCTDIECTNDTNPSHCPECWGQLMLSAMGAVSDVPLYVDGEYNPVLWDEEDEQ